MTTLLLRVPDTLRPERTHAAQVVLDTHLGLPFELVFERRADVVLHAMGDSSRTLRLPDEVFAGGDASWPSSARRPRTGTPAAALRADDAPAGLPLAAPGDMHLAFDADVFGTAFWHLSRLEEILSDARDVHGRFDASAGQDGFERPRVDELVDALGTALRMLWPSLQLREHFFRVRPSHDVDRPFKHRYQSSARLCKDMARDLRDGLPWQQVLGAPWRRRQVRRGALSLDPFNTFDWLMDASERAGLRSTFYFLCTNNPGGIDGDYTIDRPEIRALMRRIHDRGHRIGLHGSYDSAHIAGRLVAEADRLRRACDGERIPLDALPLRQHVLRFDPLTTVGRWAEAGVTEDSTLGHASHSGFRCGTSRPYPLFDVAARRPTGIEEHPLVVMDVTLTARRYENLPDDQARARMAELAGRCREHGGEFVLLWHNCRLEDPTSRELYLSGLHS